MTRYITRITDWKTVNWDEVDFVGFQEHSLESASLQETALFYHKKHAFLADQADAAFAKQAEEHLRRVLPLGINPWAFVPGRGRYDTPWNERPPDGFHGAYVALLKRMKIPGEGKWSDSVIPLNTLLDSWSEFFEEFFNWQYRAHDEIPEGNYRDHPNYARWDKWRRDWLSTTRHLINRHTPSAAPVPQEPKQPTPAAPQQAKVTLPQRR